MERTIDLAGSSSSGEAPRAGELPPEAKRILQRLSERRDQATFLEWSRWRIEHMTGKPWRQWSMAFANAVEGCQAPEQLAWVNVTPFVTANDGAPSVAAQVHGRDEHLARLLTDVLRPAA